MALNAPVLEGVARRRLIAAARLLTTPLVPDDYLGYVKPLWCTREPRGRVEAVIPETADSATVWIRPALDWVAHRPGQYVRVGWTSTAYAIGGRIGMLAHRRIGFAPTRRRRTHVPC